MLVERNQSRARESVQPAVVSKAATRRWYAARTRPRAEKAAYRALSANGVECYLPVVEQERQWADRIKRVEFPLFPGYLFIFCMRRQIGSVLAGVPGLIDVIRQDGRPCVVREDELFAVRVLVEGMRRTGKLPTVSDYPVIGNPVRVIEGPFKGLTGTLVEDRHASRVVVRISAVRMAAGIELDRTSIRPRR